MNGLDACKRQNRTTGARAMIAQSVADILSHHVKLAVEGIDRMYLNVFVPRLQHETGIVGFFREHRGQPLPSAALMQPMSRASWRSWRTSPRSTRYRWCSSARGSARM